MALLIISLLNWIFLDNTLLKILISLVIFVIVEVKRKNGEATKAMIAAEFISALILVVTIILIIVSLIYRFL